MVEIEITNRLTVKNLPDGAKQALAERLTFLNPVWVENDKMGRWNENTPRFIRCYGNQNGGLILPRGFIRQLISVLKRYELRWRLEDGRQGLESADFNFQGSLRPYQKEAVQIMLTKDFGTLAAPTGSGKTVMGLYMIAERRKPTLVVIHTKELLDQWIARIETFLGIPKEEIGQIGAGKLILGNRITVALVQTLYKVAHKATPHIGHLIVDECHRTPSRTFTEAVTAFDCKYMLGLSATPWRRDRLSKLIFWHVGDVIHQIEKDSLVESGDVLPARVITRETDFKPWVDPSLEYSQMLRELTEDEERNGLIAGDVIEEAKDGSGIILILSDRKNHCLEIQRLLRKRGTQAEVLTGDLGKREREHIVEDLNLNKIKILIATGQLIGEGFDCKELCTLFLATPIKFNGRVIQYFGRVLRPAPGKEMATIYDYIDSNVGVLVAAAKARRKVYQRNVV